MIITYNPVITGDDLSRYGMGLDTITTTTADDLIKRVQLESDIIDMLLSDTRRAIDTLAKDKGVVC